MNLLSIVLVFTLGADPRTNARRRWVSSHRRTSVYTMRENSSLSTPSWPTATPTFLSCSQAERSSASGTVNISTSNRSGNRKATHTNSTNPASTEHAFKLLPNDRVVLRAAYARPELRPRLAVVGQLPLSTKPCALGARSDRRKERCGNGRRLEDKEGTPNCLLERPEFGSCARYDDSRHAQVRRTEATTYHHISLAG